MVKKPRSKVRLMFWSLKFVKQSPANVFEGVQEKIKVWFTFLEAKRQAERNDQRFQRNKTNNQDIFPG